ncbi:hypothetical protein HDU96_002501 [Phlyctochytrium bullatum]|nr:hypothetical protein HDU96_002501 [Phlyctochytrium bullatum]
MSRALERAQSYLRGEKPPPKPAAPNKDSFSASQNLRKTASHVEIEEDESDEELKEYLQSLAKKKSATSKPDDFPAKTGHANSKSGNINVFRNIKLFKEVDRFIGATGDVVKLSEALISTHYPFSATLADDRMSNLQKAEVKSVKTEGWSRLPSAGYLKSKTEAVNPALKRGKIGDLESDSDGHTSDSDINNARKSSFSRKDSTVKATASSYVRRQRTSSSGSSNASGTSQNVEPRNSVINVKASEKTKRRVDLSSESDSSIGSDFEKYMSRKVFLKKTQASTVADEKLNLSTSLPETKAPIVLVTQPKQEQDTSATTGKAELPGVTAALLKSGEELKKNRPSSTLAEASQIQEKSSQPMSQISAVDEPSQPSAIDEITEEIEDEIEEEISEDIQNLTRSSVPDGRYDYSDDPSFVDAEEEEDDDGEAIDENPGSKYSEASASRNESLAQKGEMV